MQITLAGLELCQLTGVQSRNARELDIFYVDVDRPTLLFVTLSNELHC